jgi:hypothetical protein
MRIFMSSNVSKYTAGQTYKPGGGNEGTVTAVDAQAGLVVVQPSHADVRDKTFLGWNMSTKNPAKYALQAPFDNKVIKGVVVAVDRASKFVVVAA